MDGNTILRLICSVCCLIGGTYFVVAANNTFDENEKKLDDLYKETPETKKIERDYKISKNLSTQFIKKEVGYLIFHSENNALSQAYSEIYQKHSKQLIDWQNLTENAKSKKVFLQATLANIQFAKEELKKAGMSEEKIEDLVSQLCKKEGKQLRR